MGNGDKRGKNKFSVVRFEVVTAVIRRSVVLYCVVGCDVV
jgi:hypothetical protein